ncbi:HyaD/HybD family hydrogenase maturation endopeptidase [Thioalkalicoccus limnaeus]|uniref:HyaD/HybD family hydrogenase maturation endopeptidase n=1 Tax=Thioalkalicoccus limnaeus TaxID=120681 RepID=A0ABV4BGW9_9GAMM
MRGRPPAARPDAGPPRVLILGIGNLLWADEGFGVRVVEVLQQRWRFPAQVALLDGGTQGLNLLDRVRAADILVVFDAIDYGLSPGTLMRVEGDEVPKYLGAKKMSLHQTGFQEVLALAALLGEFPKNLLLIGVQPVELDDYGGSLRPAVKAQIEPAIALALAYLADFGIVAETCPDSTADPLGGLTHPSLALAPYEAERPSAAAAYRRGDARVLSRLRTRSGRVEQ